MALQVKLLMWSELVYKRTSVGKDPLGKSSPGLAGDDGSGRQPQVTIPVKAGRDDAAARQLQEAVAGADEAKVMDAKGSVGDAKADEVGSLLPCLLHAPASTRYSKAGF